MKSTVIEIKNSQEVNNELEMREERTIEFEDRSVETVHSEEQREKDWSKINTGSGIPIIGILEGEESETGAEKICRIDGSNLPNVMKNTDLRILAYFKLIKGTTLGHITIKLLKIEKNLKAARRKNTLHTLEKW